MKNRILFSCLILIVSLPVAAQSDSSYSTPSWFLSVHFGALFASDLNSTSATVAAMQGIRYKRLSLGVGLGYDEYAQWRTLPVFATLGYDFAKRKDGSFFIQMITGFSKAWHSTSDELSFTYKADGGYFFHPQVGYRFHRAKATFHLTAGYKLQELNYDQIPSWWNGFGGGRVSIEHDIRRVSLQLGFGLH